MTLPAQAITAIVLCGGRGRRMGHRDKPLLDYRARPVVAHIADALHGAVAAVLISANRNLEIYGRYGSVIEDRLVDHGPLAGIAACLDRCDTDYAFICPGDAPNLDISVIQRLAQALTATDAIAAVAHDGRRRQNLHLLLRASARESINRYLAAGTRSVKGWLATQATIEVDCSGVAGAFADLDYPADLER